MVLPKLLQSEFTSIENKIQLFLYFFFRANLNNNPSSVNIEELNKLISHGKCITNNDKKTQEN